jgi:hypothetical protein
LELFLKIGVPATSDAMQTMFMGLSDEQKQTFMKMVMDKGKK